MDQCEKEERFEEAATARDRILKLKNIENKKLLQDLEIKQTEEMNLLEQQRDEEIKNFQDEIDNQLKKVEEEKEQAKILLQNKHSTEKEGLIEAFDAKYPNQPKFSPEVLNLQKVMDGHIKNREYEKANEIKIKILNLCEEQDLKHKLEVKNKKLNVELEKLLTKQKYEMNNLIAKWDANKDVFKKKGNQELEKIIHKYKNRVFDLKKIHASQRIEQEKMNKKNAVIRPASQRLSHIVPKRVDETQLTNNDITYNKENESDNPNNNPINENKYQIQAEPKSNNEEKSQAKKEETEEDEEEENEEDEEEEGDEDEEEEEDEK